MGEPCDPRLNHLNRGDIHQPNKIPLIGGQQFQGPGFVCCAGVQIVMNPPASDAAVLCLFESCQDFLRVEINKIKVSRKLQNHLSRRIRVQTDGQSSAGEGRKNFPKGMGPRKAAFLVQSGSKQNIGRRFYQGTGIPICLHRASRSARIASDTVLRFSFCGNIRNPSFVRTGWTSGTSFSTSSTTLMLPSD